MNTQTTILYHETSLSGVFRGLLRWGLGVVALWYITRLFPQWLSYPRADLLQTLLDFIWAGVLLAVIQSYGFR